MSEQDNGMTLRDYFAAKAMQALMGDLHIEANGIPTSGTLFTQLALESYLVADAMLKARSAK
jgi:hypothetical protein